ncbi:hypothetical protein EMCG_00597 [[Emmonsia] crescens]|uniref:Uncharacterized protein n=1 Tax=[Emmonsia] crescens TaxID=73230 RepID=A0A0G2HTZ9_9EURO|nr:hypothetical protein EMCG_00597 [Emmonsia crescens UAMH 3008]
MDSKHTTHLLSDGMTRSERLMLSYRNWKIHDINLAATCDDIQQVLFFLRSLVYTCRGIGGIDCETINAIEDNVYHCRHAIYNFETQVLSMRYRMLRATIGEEEEEEEKAGGDEELQFPAFMRWCPFDQAAHLALKYVIDELQLVISVAVDVFLLVGGRYDNCDDCDGTGCELPLRMTNSRQCFDRCAPVEQSSKRTDGGWQPGDDYKDNDTMFTCLYHERSHIDSDDGKVMQDMSRQYYSSRQQQKKKARSIRRDEDTNAPRFTKAEPPHHVGNIPLLVQPNANDVSDIISTPIINAGGCWFGDKRHAAIERWLDSVQNEETDYSTIYDYYYYYYDHHNHHRHHHHAANTFGDIFDDGEEDSASDSASPSDSECPSTSIILEYLDGPSRGCSGGVSAAVDASYQKHRAEVGERPDDYYHWYFGDVEHLAEFQVGC